ncbi:MAG: efflux RND transporter periplasmic adaptor subunit [Polyangiaceae bacterium]|nr:efflux RND transporter periplasmic adaptor subunit [Polyangiaceae bacterium]
MQAKGPSSHSPVESRGATFPPVANAPPPPSYRHDVERTQVYVHPTPVPPPATTTVTPHSPLRTALVVVTSAATLAAVVVAGTVPKLRRGEARAIARAEAVAPRRVLVRRVAAGPRVVTLTLPATASAMRSTLVHAKTTGYVRQLGADIGEHVQAGQLLAHLELPETEQERQVARARLDEANANARLVQRITDKQTRLAESGALSAVEGDEARLRQTSAHASARATHAELRRIDALNAYQRVLSPFDGVVTRRLVDPGALVGAGTGALFEVSDVKTLRVYVDVPQSLAAAVTKGLDAEIVLPRSQSEPVRGTIVRSAGALDPTLRTLRTEIHIPGGGAVLAGSFVNVRLKLPNDKALPALPANALIVRKEGTFVATLTDDDHVHLVPVKLGRDLGKEIELLSGPAEGQRVVGNPPDDLVEGEAVRAVEAPAPEASASASASAKAAAPQASAKGRTPD